ncbi:hypothetical protein MMC07_006639 [Pseudocyphellaria aurata]|nr:hypothetical protein [Pseudocyphellaria aurata]
MSAETLGGNLLRGVKEEGFDELLESLSTLERSVPPPTGLEPIDHLLQVFQNPHREPKFPSVDHRHQEKIQASTPPVLEFTSAAACSGKTQLLYQIITLALLPAYHGTIPLHGKTSVVILLDLSSKLSILRLRDVMTAHIITCSTTAMFPIPPPEEMKSLIYASLLHLHIFRPQSSASYLSTLASLPSYFLSKPFTHVSAHRPISSIILADLSAFYWQDRLHAAESSANVAAHVTNDDHQRALVSAIRALQATFSRCPVIASTSSLSTPSALSYAGNHRALRPHMPAVWASFVTVQIVIERVAVPKFAPDISAEEASAERTMRQDVVVKGQRRGWVNWWGEGRWREEVREGVRAWEKAWGGGFEIWARDGVNVGSEE